MQCAGCKKTFTNEGLYKRHMGKKTPCVVAAVSPKVATEPASNKTKCVGCGMEFTTRGINKHMKSCPATVKQPVAPKQTPEEINRIFAEAFSPKNFNAQTLAPQIPAVPDAVVDEDLPLEEQVRLLREENKTLREVIKNLSSRATATNTTNNINTNNTININLYGLNITDLNATQLIECMSGAIKQINDIGGQYMKLNYDDRGNATGYTANYDMMVCSRRRMYFAMIDEFRDNLISIGTIGTIEERTGALPHDDTPSVSDISDANDANDVVAQPDPVSPAEEN